MALGLGACADYLKHSDTITLAAGEAKAWNSVVHTTDPWPPYVMNTRIESDGQRLAGAIERYSKGQPAPPADAGTPANGDAAAEAPAKK